MFAKVCVFVMVNTVANVFTHLLPVSSLVSCPTSRTAVFRVFRVLLPVSCLLSCPCLPTPLARHHFAPRLVITLLSCRSSLRSHARVHRGDEKRRMKMDMER